MQNDNMITVKLETLQHGNALYGCASGFAWKGVSYEIPVSEWPHNKGKLFVEVNELPAALQNCYAMKELYKFIDSWQGEWI